MPEHFIQDMQCPDRSALYIQGDIREIRTTAISRHTLLVPTGAVHRTGPVHALKLGVGAGRGVLTLVDVCNMYMFQSTLPSLG